MIAYRKVLSGEGPTRSLIEALKKRTARNHKGRITTRFRSNPSSRRLYRLVDFRQLKKDIPATVETIEYDPNRTAFISRVLYRDGERRYVLAPEGLQVGQTIVYAEQAPLQSGNRLPLKAMNPGTQVFNVELQPGKGGQLVRSAGAFAQVLGFDERYALVKLPSGEVRKILKECAATVGVVSNMDHRNIRIGKAGRNRWMGRRPRVRGSAMNPRDHPYGGGEGRATRGVRKPKTKWGKVTGGRKTRRKRKPSTRLIAQRRRG